MLNVLRPEGAMSRLLLFSTLMATCMSASAPAYACICGPGSSFTALPADGAQGVPTNAHVWILDYVSPEYVALVDVEGGLIDGAWSSFRDAGSTVLAFVPRAPLRPAAAYELRSYTLPVAVIRSELGDVALLTEGAPLLSFATGDGVDELPPSTPAVSVLDSEASWTGGRGDCDDRSGIRAGVTFGLDYEGDFVLGVIGDLPPPDVLGSTFGAARAAHEVRFGTGLCSARWDGAQPGAVGSFTFAAVDLAGNISGWSTPTVVELPDEERPTPPSTDEQPQPPDGSCAAVPMPNIVALLLVLSHTLVGRRTMHVRKARRATASR